MNYLVSIPIDIDVVVIIIVYLLASGSETGAGIFALGQGLLTDIFSGGIWGFHAILYIIIFLFIKVLSRPFDLLSAIGQVALIFMSVLVKEFLSIPLLRLFSLNMNFSSYDVLMYIVSALFSGLIAPMIFYLFNSFGRVLHRVKKEFLSPI